jgi:transposase
MIEPDKRDAIILLHTHGLTIREIAKKLKVSRNTVRAIVRNPGGNSQKPRSDKLSIDPEFLQKLFQDCDGWVQRVHEKLRAHRKIKESTI